MTEMKKIINKKINAWKKLEKGDIKKKYWKCKGKRARRTNLKLQQGHNPRIWFSTENTLAATNFNQKYNKSRLYQKRLKKKKLFQKFFKFLSF